MSDNTNGTIVAKLLYNCETVYLTASDIEVKRGDLVLIETSNGPEIASISGVTYSKINGAQPTKIIRFCSEDDLKKMRENESKEAEAFPITLEKIENHSLDMKLVHIHYFFDDNKILFSFTADERVDFRELVKDLASLFKRRIELRQIGARDEAKIVKGTGICGRDFCCTAIKNELQPVTIKMAKDQNLTLNSSKISGACGRLLCCLAYEHVAYCDIKRTYPSEGSVIEYEGKQVTISEVNILKMRATLKSRDDVIYQVPLEKIGQVTEKEPLQPAHVEGEISTEKD